MGGRRALRPDDPSRENVAFGACGRGRGVAASRDRRGLAASFFIVFVMVPVRRLVSIARREVDLNVPLIADAKGYEVVAKVIAVTLSRHGLDVQPAEPEWTATAPSRILSLFGGLSFREY